MTALRLALSELRRLTAGRLPTLAVLAVVLIPTLYASLYLWANHDPYGRLSTVPAALVVEDVPAQSEQTGTIHAGRDVAADLKEDGSFDWREVDADTAARGVEDGTFMFALTIPSGFSAALASTADFDPQKGQLILTTNEANNYLSSTIAEQVLTKVSSSIAENVSERAAASFLLGFSTLHDQLKEAGAGAAKLADGLVDAQAGAGKLADGASDLETGLTDAESGAKRLSAGADDLTAGQKKLLSGQEDLAAGITRAASGAATLSAGAAQVSAGNTQLATEADKLAAGAQQTRAQLDRVRADIEAQLAASSLTPAEQQAILDRLDDLREPLDQVGAGITTADQKIDQLAAGSRQVAGGASDLAAGLGTAQSGSAKLVAGQRDAKAGASTLADGASSLAGGLTSARTGATQLADGAGTLASGLDDGVRGAEKLASGLEDGVNSIPDLSQDRRDDTAAAIASPITTTDVAQASADSYGAGLAPFFLAIGAWVGGYVMFLLVRPLSNRAIAARQSAWRIAYGGWLTPAVLAAAQVLIMLAVVIAVVGIDVRHWTSVALFLLLVGAAFVAIVHCLNAWLGPVGQLLGLVLLVMQLASAGGTFPWQTLPPVLQGIHHVLPMTYAIDGIRHLMYGANLDSLPTDVAVLLAYVVGGIALSSAAAYRRRIWRVGQIKPEIAL